MRGLLRGRGSVEGLAISDGMGGRRWSRTAEAEEEEMEGELIVSMCSFLTFGTGAADGLLEIICEAV